MIRSFPSEVARGAQRSPRSRLIFFSSPGWTATYPSRRRVRVDGFFSNRCPRMDCRRRSLPVPVLRNRFAAVFEVFIFGIGSSLGFWGCTGGGRDRRCVVRGGRVGGRFLT